MFGIGIYTKHAFKVASLVDENYLCIASSSIIAAFVTAVFFVIKAAVDKNSPDRSECYIPYFLLHTLGFRFRKNKNLLH